jgi:uncharacterized membrane-anchored protein
MEFKEFFVWLASGLGSSFVVSYFVERWMWFQSLESEQRKMWSTFGASVLAILSYLVYTFVPAEFWVMLSPYWQIVVGVITVNYGTRIFHEYDRQLP